MLKFSLLFLTISEIWLIYSNIQARVFRPKYFYEANTFYRKYFDKNGRTYAFVSLYLQVISVYTFFIFFYAVGSMFYVGFLCGFVLINAIVDWHTLKTQLKCINKKCEYLERRLICIECKKNDGNLNEVQK